ncbi:MAG TPA: FHA domain-containing protein [Pyrinomonadaceae bacterium]|nr:FHA domain-containing protein [Pyrinomonadaceae bacterium]
MIKCPTCNTSNLDTSRFCDECGTRLVAPPQFTDPQPPAYVPPVQVEPVPRPVSATSVDIPAAVFAYENSQDVPQVVNERPGTAHAVLVIERGDSPGTEFRLINDDSTIGRWDADNGVFPDVDLDAFDSDAKVSRRHARIRRSNGSYYIEDLGSTNGTYLNRGRRLLPGNSEVLNDGDEVIVGKTFLRFQVMH